MLALVKPKSLGDLARVGRELVPAAGCRAADRSRPIGKCSPGSWKSSGVRTTSTMMELIETSRMYEANVRMIQNQDQTASSLINRILKVR